jgi:hypothetical protein
MSIAIAGIVEGIYLARIKRPDQPGNLLSAEVGQSLHCTVVRGELIRATVVDYSTGMSDGWFPRKVNR